MLFCQPRIVFDPRFNIIEENIKRYFGEREYLIDQEGKQVNVTENMTD